MFDSEDRQMAVSRQLELLVRDFGEELVAEGLGVEDDALSALLTGDVEMDDDALTNLERMCGVLGAVAAP